jgi:hypothetical protein
MVKLLKFLENSIIGVRKLRCEPPVADHQMEPAWRTAACSFLTHFLRDFWLFANRRLTAKS